MWRSTASRYLLRSLRGAGGPKTIAGRWPGYPAPLAFAHRYLSSSPSPSSSSGSGSAAAAEESITSAEARRLMRLVNVESLKRQLGKDGDEVIGYNELLAACEGTGVVRSRNKAVAFARVLDDAGVVLLFRDKVYLYPDKVVDLVRRAVPLALTPENDPRKDELKQLQQQKDVIDMLAHKHVRRILWSGLGFLVIQASLFFRLTFWEFSWDVMEPVTFFTTTTGLVLGYGYFLFTSRDPTYRDLMHRLFLSRQRKLFQKQKFDLQRYIELQKHCKCPLDKIAGIGQAIEQNNSQLQQLQNIYIHK